MFVRGNQTHNLFKTSNFEIGTRSARGGVGLYEQKSLVSYSARSFGNSDSHLHDDYWIQKVDKLIQDKKQVINMIKDKNREVREANDQN